MFNDFWSSVLPPENLIKQQAVKTASSGGFGSFWTPIITKTLAEAPASAYIAPNKSYENTQTTPVKPPIISVPTIDYAGIWEMMKLTNPFYAMAGYAQPVVQTIIEKTPEVYSTTKKAEGVLANMNTTTLLMIGLGAFLLLGGKD